jgi:hypothetical protein
MTVRHYAAGPARADRRLSGRSPTCRVHSIGPAPEGTGSGSAFPFLEQPAWAGLAWCCPGPAPAPPRPASRRAHLAGSQPRAEVRGGGQRVRAERLREPDARRRSRGPGSPSERPSRGTQRRPCAAAASPAWRSAGCSPSRATSSEATWATGRPRSRCRYALRPAYVTRSGCTREQLAGPWRGGRDWPSPSRDLGPVLTRASVLHLEFRALRAEPGARMSRSHELVGGGGDRGALWWPLRAGLSPGVDVGVLR